MVSHRRSLALALGLATCLAGTVSAGELSDYRLGDRIEADITTPVALKVMDPEATAALKQREAARVPVVVRHDPGVATEMEAKLEHAFWSTRTNFLRSVDGYFKNRKLTPATVASPEFELVRATFQRFNNLFPVTTNLAAAWARGDLGRDEQTAAISRFRAIQRRPIRDEGEPEGLRLTPRVRLVNVTNWDETLTLEVIAHRGRNLSRTNLTTLDLARRELRQNFPPEEAVVAEFVAALLQPNCWLEEKLTAAFRAQQTETLWVLTEYQPGEIVAHTGQPVNAKVFAALQAIQEKQTEARLKATAALAVIHAREARAKIKWLAGGAGVVTFALVVVSWQWWRRRREVSLLPVRASIGQLAAGSPEVAVWQQRAIQAERRVEHAHETLRAGVMTQVSSVLKDKLVHDLIVQRQDLLQAQQAAASEMQALEKRLDEIRAPLQERLRTYEARIAELEKTLAAKDEQNRELIKARIALVRQQLEAEGAPDPMVLN